MQLTEEQFDEIRDLLPKSRRVFDFSTASNSSRSSCANSTIVLLRHRTLLIPRPLPVHYYKHVLLEWVAY